MNQRVNVGVVGYCPPTRFDEVEAQRMIVEAYDNVAQRFPDHEIVIVSGLTAVGVLKIAYEEATRRGWFTVGIACKRAEEHPLYPVDTKMISGDNWGDESFVFLKYIDGIIRIGMGMQSIAETEATKQNGGFAYEFDLPTLN